MQGVSGYNTSKTKTGMIMNAQDHINALRDGRFFTALDFNRSLQEKYAVFNPEITYDELVPLAIYELSQTDLVADDSKLLDILISCLSKDKNGQTFSSCSLVLLCSAIPGALKLKKEKAAKIDLTGKALYEEITAPNSDFSKRIGQTKVYPQPQEELPGQIFAEYIDTVPEINFNNFIIDFQKMKLTDVIFHIQPMIERVLRNFHRETNLLPGPHSTLRQAQLPVVAANAAVNGDIETFNHVSRETWIDDRNHERPYLDPAECLIILKIAGMCGQETFLQTLRIQAKAENNTNLLIAFEAYNYVVTANAIPTMYEDTITKMEPVFIALARLKILVNKSSNSETTRLGNQIERTVSNQLVELMHEKIKPAVFFKTCEYTILRGGYLSHGWSPVLANLLAKIQILVENLLGYPLLLKNEGNPKGLRTALAEYKESYQNIKPDDEEAPSSDHKPK